MQLGTLQKAFESFYELDTGYHVDDFLITDRELVRILDEAEDDVGLYLVDVRVGRVPHGVLRFVPLRDYRSYPESEMKARALAFHQEIADDVAGQGGKAEGPHAGTHRNGEGPG